MANIRIGSHSSHNYQVAEKITEAKQLNWSDSGKIFFVHTENGQGTYVINLPKLSEEICGWQAKFVLCKRGDAVHIMSYGVPAAGLVADSDANTDENTVAYAEITTAGNHVATSYIDGTSFGQNAQNIGSSIQVHTDGTYWYTMGTGGYQSDIANVNT
jgi:aspartate 1-decarboxylase